MWTTGQFAGAFTFDELAAGLPYSLSLLFILTCHEFGHYFAGRYHKVDATLPFYIPIPPFQGFLHFGTMGAVIKTKSPVTNNRAMFDIGVAGPVAGFVASLIILIYGFVTLPGPEYILSIHPDFFSPEYGSGDLTLFFGDNLLFVVLEKLFTNSSQFVPPMSEVYHFPYLMAGWFGLFVTAMNMIPVGQLDGGHVIISMFGPIVHEKIARISLFIISFIGVAGFADYFLELNLQFGWIGWLLWTFILVFIIKVKHPPILNYSRLGTARMLIGYFSIVILILSFTPTPFYGDF